MEKTPSIILNVYYESRELLSAAWILIIAYAIAILSSLKGASQDDVYALSAPFPTSM